MPIDVQLPELAAGVTAARLSAWLKREGDRVEAGEPIVEFETDKTNVEVEAPASGILTGLRFAPGSEVPVGAVVAVVAPASMATSDISLPSSPESAMTATSGAPTRIDVPVPPVVAMTKDDRVRATPLAAMMAKVAGVDLKTVRPTGPGARVTKADISALLQTPSRQQVIAKPAMPPSSGLPATAGGFHDVALSAMRRGTASRLQESKQSIPHFYLQTECRVDTLLACRQDINAKLTDLKISVTDFVVFAVARALTRVPQANSMWNQGSVRVFDDVDISVAVNTPKGLITPIIRRAQAKTLTVIARELKALTDQARAGSLQPEQYTGGTVTISNLGMYKVTSIMPILNPPQACILGIGSIERKPVIVNDAVTPGSIMTVTLAADHRTIDGATGAELLSELRHLLEEPFFLALHA